MRVFIGFVVLSGLGWLCDFATFSLLVGVLQVPEFVANVISSYVGVTFVWFTSLGTLFRHAGASRGSALYVYWSYQLLSIMMYSQLLHLIAAALVTSPQPLLAAHPGIAAKILVTPINLLTNFFFMKLLTRHMQSKAR